MVFHYFALFKVKILTVTVFGHWSLIILSIEFSLGRIYRGVLDSKHIFLSDYDDDNKNLKVFKKMNEKM